ncbi:MAG: nitrous oxide-stimulated promoter family protein [Thermodesulfobacteriota bacterium]
MNDWVTSHQAIKGKNASMLRKTGISKKEKADIQTLMDFVAIYCRENHHGEKIPFTFKFLDLKEITKKEIPVCLGCYRLLTYGLTMRLKCPHDPKPMCKKCETQCYHGDYKKKIREVMKFSGMYLVKRGRVDLLYHYFV